LRGGFLFCTMKKLVPVILFALIALLLLPFGYASIRGFFLQLGWGWMVSEWSYYVLLILMGIFAGYLVVRMWASGSNWKKFLVGLIAAILPFTLGFVQHPIYEDMLWDLSQDMSKVQGTSDYRDTDLLVIAIADCPYCKRAVTEMKALHERNAQLRMRMVVCTADSSWLEPYIEEAGGAFEVVMADDMDVLATHAGGHFPAYVLVRDGKPVCRWTNNEWGPVAKDIVEKGEVRGTKDDVR